MYIFLRNKLRIFLDSKCQKCVNKRLNFNDDSLSTFNYLNPRLALFKIKCNMES